MESRDRHYRLQQLVEAALSLEPDKRREYLASACDGDPELFSEVVALITANHGADSLLSTVTPTQPTDQPVIQPGSFAGQTFGHYQILELIGRGGMGEVYRARDTRLARHVAIKFVPPEVAGDEYTLRRIEREARMLASLNHPNIATIHGLEHFEASRLLVMELVEGDTLSQVITRGPMPVEAALTIFRQIAEALEAAHQKEVIHRDLKPGNIKLSAEGRVKLLDFGLAKNLDVTQSLGATVSEPIESFTASGLIVGTPGYMSPEQTKGESVDRRADIWAFGALLFEALTGERAFGGVSLAELFGNILYREPNWSKLPSSVPQSLHSLVKRCLQKEASERPQSMRDVLDVILSAANSPEPEQVESRPSSKTGRGKLRPATAGQGADGVIESKGRGIRRPAALMLGALGLAAAVLWYWFRDRPLPLPQLTNPIQVTRGVGVEDYPTWSPDSRTLAYESNQTGNWDIWVAQVGGGSGVNLTAEHSGTDRYPSWSPDGLWIAFWSDRKGGGYYLIPALGGTAQLVAPTPGWSDLYQSPPTWSPDSSQLALGIYKVVAKRLTTYLEIVSLATRDVQDVPLPGSEEMRADLSWSPDGQYVAYVDVGSQLGEVSVIKLLRMSDKSVRDVTDGRSNARSPHWGSTGEYLYFTANRAGATDWWRQRIKEDRPSGEPESVTSGLEVLNGAFSADSKKLAYSKGRWVSNVWRVPILEGRPATWADARQITFEQAYIEWSDLSADGRELAFSSDRTGNQDLWRMPIEGNQATRLTAEPTPDWCPNWSPDGKQLAYYSYRTGDREIWVLPASGGAATQLTNSKAVDAGPRWSPDGLRISFRSERTGNSEVWVMGADGGNQRQLTHDPAGDYGGSWSPDGKWLAFFSNRSGRMQIWRVLAEGGGEPELLSRGSGVSPTWCRDGERIVFVGSEERIGNLWILSLKDRSERPLTNLTGKRGTLGYMPPATDGRFVYFTWRDDLGDIWVTEVN